MFAKLTGQLDSISEEGVVVDVNGVGYLVSVSRLCLDRLGGAGSHVRLLIDTHVREDKIALYGFADREEQAWFRLLTTVPGVGAKVALSVLSTLSPAQLNVAVASGDAKALSRADGVGPKLAARLSSELKGKAAQIAPIMSIAAVSGGKSSVPASSSSSPSGAGATPDSGALGDAVSALINLGYGRSEAYSAVMTVRAGLDDNTADVSTLIRLSLKEIAAA
jgi:Holliday junction DNA helicase RuvA